MRININATGFNTVPFLEGIMNADNTDELLIVVYLPGNHLSEAQIVDLLEQRSGTRPLTWLRPSSGRWFIDADHLISDFQALSAIHWFAGTLAALFRVAGVSERGSLGNFAAGHGLAMIGHHPFNVATFLLNEDIAAESNSVFYSWMSDRHSFSNRSFIEDCLSRAVKQIAKDPELRVVPSLDRDIKGEAGASDIAATIFRKIEFAQAFVADVTIAASPLSGWKRRLLRWVKLPDFRPAPNPNVLVELGYAAGVLGWNRCLLVVNTAFGDIDDLPFDLRGRSVVQYRVLKRADRAAAKASFTPLLKAKLVEILAQ
jgi:hypothetical protein